MAGETWVQSLLESYQRLKKWYLIPPCLTLSIIRYRSRVKWSNPGKGVGPFPTRRCSSYRKGILRVALDYGHQLYLLCTNAPGKGMNPSVLYSVIFCNWFLRTNYLVKTKILLTIFTNPSNRAGYDIRSIFLSGV